MEHNTWVSDCPDVSMGQTPHQHTHIHCVCSWYIEELSANLYHMWVRQSDTKRPFFQQNQDTQRAMVTMMKKACPQTHMHPRTHSGMSAIKTLQVWDGIILRSGKESRSKHRLLLTAFFSKKLNSIICFNRARVKHCSFLNMTYLCMFIYIHGTK